MIKCKDDPRAPHGFCRNASHSLHRYVCECEFWEPPENMTTPFEQWYDGIVGFHINSERILDDLFHYRPDAEDAIRLRKWMVVCWNNAIEAAQQTAWEINQPPSEEACFIADGMEVLKEKP